MYPPAYYAAVRSALLTNALHSCTIAGNPVVLFRDERGVPHALYDRCAHRGMPLSKGRLKNHTVECPYHGWCYAGTGDCVKVPECEHIPARARVPAYAAYEHNGYIFVNVFPADLPHRWAPPELPEADESGWRGVFHSRETVACGFALMVENVIDGAHLPFVHEGSLEGGQGIGFSWARRFRGKQSEVPPELEIVPTGTGFIAQANVVRQTRRGSQPLGFRFRVQMPSTVTVELDFGERKIRVWVHTVPIGPHRCRVEHGLLRNFLLTRWLDPLFLHSARRILSEDIVAVEAQSINYQQSDLSWEVSVPRDRLALTFRKLLRQVSHLATIEADAAPRWNSPPPGTAQDADRLEPAALNPELVEPR